MLSWKSRVRRDLTVSTGLVAYQNGKEIDRQIFHLAGSHLTGKSPYIGRASFSRYFDEVALFAKCRFQGEGVELVRQKVTPPDFQAEAVARPDKVINPVDLGAILVPLDWLLLSGGQKGNVELAAISRNADIPDAKAQAWLESSASNKSSVAIKLEKDCRAQITFPIPSIVALPRERHIACCPHVGGRERTLAQENSSHDCQKPPKLPEFGATELKLRYDAPISVRDPRTGKFSSMSYDTAWAPSTQRCGDFPAQWFALRVLARFLLHPFLGQHSRYGNEL